MSYEGLPRSCRYCVAMVCGGDMNYCAIKEIIISDAALPKARKCPYWVGRDMAADSFKIWEPRQEKQPKECEGQEVLSL